MNKTNKNESAIVELLVEVAKADDSTVKSILDEIPELLLERDIIMTQRDGEATVLVSSDTPREKAMLVSQIVILLSLYSGAYEAGAIDQFHKLVPKEHRKHIKHLIEMVQKHENFPIIHYRMSRTKDFLVGPIISRKLTLESGLSKQKLSFHEVLLTIQDQNDEKNVRLELDDIETRLLIEDLTRLIE